MRWRYDRRGERRQLYGFCEVCSYDRQHAVKLLNAGPSAPKDKAGRKPVYAKEVLTIINSITPRAEVMGFDTVVYTLRPMNLEDDCYTVCQLLRGIQTHKTERRSDDSFAMNLATMAVMFAASYHLDDFRQYWRFVTKEPFPADRLSAIAAELRKQNEDVAGA